MFFVFVFIYSGSKNYPENTKISKKVWNFLQKNFGKIFWLTLKKISAKIIRFWSKKLILQDFGKIQEKKICQNGKFGSVVPVKQVRGLIDCQKKWLRIPGVYHITINNCNFFLLTMLTVQIYIMCMVLFCVRYIKILHNAQFVPYSMYTNSDPHWKLYNPFQQHIIYFPCL